MGVRVPVGVGFCGTRLLAGVMLMTIYEWQIRHGISAEAMRELMGDVLSAPYNFPVSDGGMSEAAGQQQIRLEAPKHGVRLWRNNVGACVDERGNHIRYGLCNESPAMNRQLKSADLIGITPITITPAHVGAVLGVFTSIECKRQGWVFNERNLHEQAQLAWAQLVIGLGGIAQFATGPGDVWGCNIDPTVTLP